MPSSRFRNGLALTAALAFAIAIGLAGSGSARAAEEPNRVATPNAQPKPGSASRQPRRILILHSFGPNFQPWSAWSREIGRELNRQSPWPLDIQEQSLITARDGDDPSESKFIEYLAGLYGRRPPDLIIAIGAPTAHFVQRHRTALFPTTPMLIGVIEARRVDPSTLSEQDAVVAVRTDQVALFENILRVLPDTKTVAVIAGNSPNERFWSAELKRVVGPLLENRAKLLFYNEQPFEDILHEVARLPPHSAIFYQQMAVDSKGAVYADKEPWKRIGEVANAPMFSHDETYFTGELVGGPMWSPAEGAPPTATVAIRILGGERAGDIKVPPIEFPPPKYEWRQLKRWGISESLLPQGSEVVNREPAIWDTYRWQLITIITALLLQGALIFLLLERHRRQAAEMDSQQRVLELAHVNRFSTAGEMAASIAHEINQPLGAILNNVETAKIILKTRSPDLNEIGEIVSDIGRDNTRATEVIRHLRSYVKKVPSEQRRFDLNDEVAEAVKFLTPEARTRGIILQSKLASVPLPISGHPIQIEQVLSNLILNAMDAMSEVGQSGKVVSVATAKNGHSVEVSVADSGPGVPPDAIGKIFDPFFSTKDHGMGMGLSIVRTIVEAHNGHIEVDNRNGTKGAVFRVKLPLA
jgi:signal transduction histidine kinase